MHNPRSEFWTAARQHLEQQPPAFTAVDELFQSFQNGLDLQRAPTPPGVLHGMEHPVGGPPGEFDRGPRCFLIEWQPGSITGIHGHPPLMYMAVISGSLIIDEFERDKTTGHALPSATQVIDEGQAIHRTATNDRWDNFIHRVRTLEPTWSLHFYGDCPSLGFRFDDQGHLVAT